VKELKPKLILTNGDSRRGSSFKQFLIILIVFVIGVFVGLSIGGKRALDDSNGEIVVDASSGKKSIDRSTGEEGRESLKDSSASLKNDFTHENEGVGFKISSKDKDNAQDNKKYRTGEHTGIVKPKGVHSVQVGAFKEIERAHKAQRDLTSRGYDPYVIPYVNSLGEIWFLVRIGKFDSRNRAEEFAIHFQKSETMEAFVEESD